MGHVLFMSRSRREEKHSFGSGIGPADDEDSVFQDEGLWREGQQASWFYEGHRQLESSGVKPDVICGREAISDTAVCPLLPLGIDEPVRAVAIFKCVLGTVQLTKRKHVWHQSPNPSPLKIGRTLQTLESRAFSQRQGFLQGE